MVLLQKYDEKCERGPYLFTIVSSKKRCFSSLKMCDFYLEMSLISKIFFDHPLKIDYFLRTPCCCMNSLKKLEQKTISLKRFCCKKNLSVSNTNDFNNFELHVT